MENQKKFKKPSEYIVIQSSNIPSLNLLKFKTEIIRTLICYLRFVCTILFIDREFGYGCV